VRAPAVLCGLLLLRFAQAPPPQTQAQSRPVFRGGTRFVRVDAYPSDNNGRAIEGLKAGDFEILEDGTPQAIDSLDFIRFDTYTPESERKNPSSQREGFELAADPRYRVFVIFVDMRFSSSNGIAAIRQPLLNFIDRVIGVHDLFGLMASTNKVNELVLGQKTTVTEEQVNDLLRASRVDYDPSVRFDPNYEPECLAGCSGACVTKMQARYHADQTYTVLRELVALLGSVREERKNIVFVSDALLRWRDDIALHTSLIGKAGPAKTGIDNGRIDRGDPGKTPITDDFCADAANRLPLMDFENRYQQLLTEAQQANIAFYMMPPTATAQRADDGLVELSRETGGTAITESIDLNAALRRVADDQQAYYVLGYYTTNTKFDGKVRKITVKLKGQTIRARREYRAPTPAEIAAMANRPVAPPIQSGPPSLVGEPAAFRVTLRQAPEKTSRLEFTRSDRLRVEWPVLSPLDRREARLLDSTGKPLPIDVPLSENEGAKTIVAELALAPFGKGVYSIELTAGAGGKTEQRRLTFTMK
jgi:VWFA-related protein